MATTGYFTGVASPGVLAAAFGAGQMFDASLSAAPGGLTYSFVGEFGQTAPFVAAAGSLSAQGNFDGGVFDAMLAAVPSLLTADFGAGRAFEASLQGVATLSAEWLPGDLFDGSFVSAAGELSAGSQKGLVFDAVLVGKSTLAAVVGISPSGEVTTAWVVNLTTGGHARYVGPLDGSAQVDAYAITPATDFGTPQSKYVRDIYAHMRSAGEVVITTTTDEQLEHLGDEILDDGKAGIHRRRDKRPRGINGGTWQIKFANVDGAAFTLKQLEVTPILSARIAQ